MIFLRRNISAKRLSVCWRSLNAQVCDFDSFTNTVLQFKQNLKCSFVENCNMADVRCCGSERDGSFTDRILNGSGATSLIVSSFDWIKFEINKWNSNGIELVFRENIYFSRWQQISHCSWVCFLLCMFTSRCHWVLYRLPRTSKWHSLSGVFLLVGSNNKPYEFQLIVSIVIHFIFQHLVWIDLKWHRNWRSSKNGTISLSIKCRKMIWIIRHTIFSPKRLNRCSEHWTWT